MDNRKKILFIINPISGVGRKNSIPPLVEKLLDHTKFSHAIRYTEHRGHGHEIANAEKENYDCIVAVGGDGSVNEIGSALLHSKCALAVIPCGSGNGLARHAGIPMKHKNAIERINQFAPKKVDAGSVNGTIFLGTCGFGFDAHVAKKFDQFHKRGFFSYVKLVLREYKKWKPLRFKISAPGLNTEREAMLCSVANSSQFGNGFTISPLSDFSDGKFELIFLERTPWYSFPRIAFYFFTKRIHRSRRFESVSFTNAIQLKLPSGVAHVYHLDGEPMEAANTFEIEILPSSLMLV